jgi:hypothetical protein
MYVYCIESCGEGFFLPDLDVPRLCSRPIPVDEDLFSDRSQNNLMSFSPTQTEYILSPVTQKSQGLDRSHQIFSVNIMNLDIKIKYSGWTSYIIPV